MYNIYSSPRREIEREIEGGRRKWERRQKDGRQKVKMNYSKYKAICSKIARKGWLSHGKSGKENTRNDSENRREEIEIER